MSAIIGAKNDIAAARDLVDIGNISFSGFVYIWSNISVIEDDHGPARNGFLTVGDGHQGVDLQAFGKIGDIITAVICTGVKNLFDDNITAGIFACAHGTDLKRMWNRC